MKLDFTAAVKANKKAFRNQEKKLVGVKTSTPGVTVIADMVYCPQDTKTTPQGNTVKEILVRIVEFVNFPEVMARSDPNNPGSLLVKRRELQNAATKTYAWSADEVPLKPGDEISLSFIGVSGAPIPDLLMSKNASELTLRISALRPKHYTKKNGEKSIDTRTGEPRVYWDCGKSVVAVDGYNNLRKAIKELQHNIPLWKCAFPAKRPMRKVKQDDGTYLDKTTSARRAILFGTDTKTDVHSDGTKLFVHNTGPVSVDKGEYVAGQGGVYKNMGIMVSLYALYNEETYNPVDETTSSRLVYQNTMVRLETHDGLITKSFGIMDPPRWKALAPHFIRALKGIIFVKDPYDKKQELIDNIKDYAETNELADGGSEEAAAVIAAGNGVQRGTVVTIDRIMIDMPDMIRQIGTEVSLAEALRVTEGFADAKTDANSRFNSLPQNQAANPYKLPIICLSNFRKSADADTLKNFKIYLVTPSKKWNNGSGKSAEQIIAEFEANEDVDREEEDRTFDTRMCAFFAVNDSTSDEVQEALEAMAGITDMDLAPTDVGPSAKPEEEEHRTSVRASPEPEDKAKKSIKSSKKHRNNKKKEKRATATEGFEEEPDEDEE